jgi:hypothetical protein
MTLTMTPHSLPSAVTLTTAWMTSQQTSSPMFPYLLNHDTHLPITQHPSRYDQSPPQHNLHPHPCYVPHTSLKDVEKSASALKAPTLHAKNQSRASRLGAPHGARTAFSHMHTTAHPHTNCLLRHHMCSAPPAHTPAHHMLLHPASRLGACSTHVFAQTHHITAIFA